MRILHNKTLFLIIIISLVLLFLIIIISNKEKTLTDNDVKKELEKLEKINRYPENMKINPEGYPKIIGGYSKNGLNLVEIYYCSDLCPDYAHVYMIFENISKEKCSEIGEEVNAVFPPQYLGCKPKIDITDKENDTEIGECITNEDCVYAQCCHPSSCVPITNKPNCEGIFCTQECAPGTLDCNQGSCKCIRGKCKAVFNE